MTEIVISKFTNLDTELDNDNHRELAAQMLSTAAYYTKLLDGEMTFEEFTTEVEACSGYLEDLLEGGDIDEDNYQDYLADFILEDNLGIDMTISYPHLDYRGATIMVAAGGPNIWIDTTDGYIHGSWGTLTMQTPFVDNVGLDDRLEEMFLEVR